MFLLDANVLIEASRTYYSVRIAPTYWAWLADQHLAGNIASVASVRKEIDDGKAGHLTTWATTLPPTFWIQPSQPSIQAMTVLTAWTMDPREALHQRCPTSLPPGSRLLPHRRSPCGKPHGSHPGAVFACREETGPHPRRLCRRQRRLRQPIQRLREPWPPIPLNRSPDALVLGGRHL